MSERMAVEGARSVLLVVDLQPDFLPGGALAVAGGDEILAPIAALMEGYLFPLVVATQDWHPRGHVSFASSHAGRRPFDRISLYGREQVLWPDHCVQRTPGADLRAGLPWERAAAIVRKGTDPRVDSYSAFRNNWDASGRRPATGLAGFLRERGVHDVYLCGLARDYCVAWSAADAVEAGFRTSVLWDLTRAVDPAADDAVLRSLRTAGADVVVSSALTGG